MESWLDGKIWKHKDENSKIPKEAEGPVHEDVVAGCEGDADEDEEEVGHRKV